MKENIIKEVKCLRCGKKWFPQKPGLPVTCRWCRSPYWNKSYIRKRGV